MKVIIYGATGGLGQHVWRGAVDAGHEVAVFVRSPAKLDAADPRHARLSIHEGDVVDTAAARQAATGCQIAINCTSPAGGHATIDLAKSIVGAAADAGVERFYMVGGIGALWVPGTGRQVLVQDWDDVDGMRRYGFPADLTADQRRGMQNQVRTMTAGHLASMAYLASTPHRHTFICPGSMVEGPTSPGRTVTRDELGGYGALQIGFADVAEVIIDDLVDGDLLGHRVCVAPEPSRDPAPV
ncbi:MAG: NAD(P)-binding oxidoreductase [Myxococcota bacterium]